MDPAGKGLQGMTVRILIGDVRDKLAELADESVHCVVTSPPYWGLRDYGVEGQIGLEADFRDYVATMVAVLREVRRVLRRDGTLWLNLGDSYATGAGSYRNPGSDVVAIEHGGKHAFTKDYARAQPNRMPQDGLKPKDLTGIPWRVAFALQDDGWWLRQDIIWSKPNPMPESVTDRCTKAHEYLFLLSKSERYHFDAQAIAEEGSGRIPGDVVPCRLDARHGDEGRRLLKAHQREQLTRNKRSVWTVATAPYSEAHFATFPPALVEPCILAGCPKGGTVLDPFGGAGTTGLVADRLGRNAILIELNPEYAEMARRRIDEDRGPLFAEAAD